MSAELSVSLPTAFVKSLLQPLPAEWYRLAFRESAMGLAITSLEDGRFVDVSAAFLEMNEYTYEEVLGKTAAEISHIVDPAHAKEFRRLVRDVGVVTNFETQVRTKTGRIRNRIINGHTINYGGRRCFLSCGIDVTERDRVIRQAADRERRLASLFSTSLVAIAMTKDGLVTEVNQAFTDLTGYLAVDLVQKPWDDVKALLRGSGSAASAATQGAMPKDPTEVLWQHRSGESMTVLVWEWPLDGANPGRGATILALDQTSRKKSEQEIVDAFSELSAVYMNAPSPMMLVDGAGLVRRVNHAALDYFSVTPDRCIGADVRELLRCAGPESEECGTQPRCSRCLVQRMIGLLGGDATNLYRVETSLRSLRNGVFTQSTLVFSAVPVAVAEGPSSYLICFEDVTEERAMQRRLVAAEKLETLGRLVAGVAHDYNNIMTSILFRIELMKNVGGLAPKVLENLEGIADDIRQSTGLSRQLMVLAQSRSRQVERISLASLILGMQAMLERFLGSTIRLAINVDATEGWVRGEGTMLEQVLLNLCLNARDAMPAGGELGIRLSRGRHQKPDTQGPSLDCLCIQITDTGIGMSSAVRSRLFEPFFTTKVEGKGTGLGLASVRTIVERHGGWINVESEPGAGSRFIVHLPAESEQGDAAGARPNHAPAVAPSRILLIECDSLLGQMAQIGLTRLGFDVTREETCNVEKLEPLLAGWDAVVCCEGMSAALLEACRRRGLPKLPVVILAGEGFEAPEWQASVVPKPYVIADLAAHLSRRIESASALPL